ncbi:hypothetical protein Cme02nite_44060 [Catellatospora methionotrophica]|uniref:Uncharacterized protein n=1 Tax=Catellatospora methionotrophica TaxID=121620 RepID=A0A8J3LI92_9ACTN|nr:hypothetical protein [Catellatospora methionotrophica]GIG16074.1 hypothetical protein Cme02nite_44060 [Catellatospora methionotrophica]
MGALVTLELPAGSPQLDLPWIITFGPLDDDEEWEPVVCGPYERPHALALAQHVVADEDLMAVVEPLLPATSLEQIRAEIANAQDLAAQEADEIDDVLDDDADDDDDHDHDHDHDDHVVEAPSAADLKAGFARISARLTGS